MHCELGFTNMTVQSVSKAPSSGEGSNTNVNLPYTPDESYTMEPITIIGDTRKKFPWWLLVVAGIVTYQSMKG